MKVRQRIMPKLEFWAIIRLIRLNAFLVLFLDLFSIHGFHQNVLFPTSTRNIAMRSENGGFLPQKKFCTTMHCTVFIR